jgi:hypothetical protein
MEDAMIGKLHLLILLSLIRHGIPFFLIPSWAQTRLDIFGLRSISKLGLMKSDQARPLKSSPGPFRPNVATCKIALVKGIDVKCTLEVQKPGLHYDVCKPDERWNEMTITNVD